MHDMLGEFFHAHGLECASADVQRNKFNFNAFFLQRIDDFFGEMKTCRGSGHRTGCFRINRLITLFIAFVGGVFNIRRKRNFAEKVEHFQYWMFKAQGEKFTFAPCHFHFFLAIFCFKNQKCSRLRALAGASHGNRGVFARNAFD